MDPSRAASDAERVTQNVTAITLISKRKPEREKKTQRKHVFHQRFHYIIKVSSITR